MKSPNYTKPLTDTDRAVTIMLRTMGYPVARIAAFFDVNPGRISEVWQHHISGTKQTESLFDEPPAA